MPELSRTPGSEHDVIGEPPYPGSREAIDRGCTCPRLDNGRGNPDAARDRGGWWITVGCPLHHPTDVDDAA